MKKILKWLLILLFLLIPLILLGFVSLMQELMRWKLGSPLVPGNNWLRWSQAYLVLGSLFCLGLYIPIIIAMKKRLKLLIIPCLMIVVFVIGSIALAAVGRKIYHDQQLSQVKRALEENPNNVTALEDLGNAYSGAGEHKKAIEIFNKALAVTTNPAYVIHDRGLAYWGDKQYAQAISDFTKAMELKPDEKNFVAQCYNDRAVAYFHSGDFQKSYGDVTMAIELGYNVNPSFLSALESKGFQISQQ